VSSRKTAVSRLVAIAIGREFVYFGVPEAGIAG
jgi:hypothetical protein